MLAPVTYLECLHSHSICESIVFCFCTIFHQFGAMYFSCFRISEVRKQLTIAVSQAEVMT